MIKIGDRPHKRYNQLSGEWILVSPHRTKRPWHGKVEDVLLDQPPSYDPKCYLCPGNERSGRNMNPSYDSTYVFNNDFAALLDEGSTDEVSDGLFRVKGERGICKVFCFSSDHALTIPEMDEQSLVSVVKMWKKEFQTLAANPSIPNEIEKRTITQELYYQKHARSLLEDYISQELEDGSRVVCKNEHFICLVPVWATWPYETMIIPNRHFSAISEMKKQEEVSFAKIIKEITVRYDNLFNTSFPYSAGMQQRPTDGQQYPGWHFHYSFYPPLLRSASVKKFMVGYEMFGGPQRDITAEQAASTLRELSSVHYKKKINNHEDFSNHNV